MEMANFLNVLLEFVKKVDSCSKSDNPDTDELVDYILDEGFPALHRALHLLEESETGFGRLTLKAVLPHVLALTQKQNEKEEEEN